MRRNKVLTLGVIGIAVLAVMGLCAIYDRRRRHDVYIVRKSTRRGVEGLIPCNPKKFALLKEHNDRMKKGPLTDEEWQELRDEVPFHYPAYDGV